MKRTILFLAVVLLAACMNVESPTAPTTQRSERRTLVETKQYQVVAPGGVYYGEIHFPFNTMFDAEDPPDAELQGLLAAGSVIPVEEG